MKFKFHFKREFAQSRAVQIFGLDKYVRFKMLIIMKLTILLLMFFTLSVHATVNAQRIDLQVSNERLENVFDELYRQSGYAFVFNAKHLQYAKLVTVNLKGMPVEQAIKVIMSGQPLDYSIDEKVITVKKKKEIEPVKSKIAIKEYQNSETNERIIEGLVTSKEDGRPLQGVSVLVHGTSSGTQTSSNGSYKIVVPSGYKQLTFKALGFLSQTVFISSGSIINVSLDEDSKQLGEIMIVGYGTQRKKETTGSIASIKASELTQTPVVNVAQGLQGRVSGVQVTQNSGTPGGSISVRIRGTNSIGGTSEPLYVIDGMQISNGGEATDISPLSTINPADIESVEILKDASATAIYGSRAANGVVLITTKRGKAGVTTTSFESYYGLQEVNKMLPTLNAAQFAQLENEVFKNNNFSDPASFGEGTNWQKLIFNRAPIQNHQISVNGGSEKTQLALSVNYFNQDGIILESNFKRYSYRLNVDHQISSRVKIGTNILGSYMINNAIKDGGTTESLSKNTVLTAVLGVPPMLKPYREDGSRFNFVDQYSQYREILNPLNILDLLNKTATKRTLASLYAEATVIKDLTYRASFNADLISGLNDTYSPLSILHQNEININSGSGSKSNSNTMTLLHESVVTYTKTFASLHRVKFTGLFSSQTSQYNANTMNAVGFPNDATTNEALQLAQGSTINTNKNRSDLISYMGRINYGFKDKYFIDVTARVDGSSKFGANNKYGFFPAASAAWNIVDEKFMHKLDWISDLKLRLSYGMTGNAGAIAPYQSLNTVESGIGYSFNHVYSSGISPSGISNPDLKWEKSLQKNIGLDVGLFKNKLSFVVDLYHKNTKDMLYLKTLPLSSGYPSITGNFAALENKGIEFATNAKILSGDFKWDLSANITINRNKVLELDGGVTSEKFVTTYTILKIGEPLGLFKTYVFDGINQTGETILPGYDGRLGGHKVKDLNGDMMINSDDQTITGNPNPKFIYGFSSNMFFKNFDLSLFFSGTEGNDIYNLARYVFENPLGTKNMLKGLENRWSPTNPNNEYASGFQGGRLPISNNFVEDGSYLRCKNITLGYRLPKIGVVKNIRLYISGNNLFVLTKYRGYDPEVNSFGDSNTRIGIDNLIYPPSRSLLGGLQVVF